MSAEVNTDLPSVEEINELLKNACVDVSKATCISGHGTHFGLWNHLDLVGAGRLVVPWNRQPLIASEIAYDVSLRDASGNAIRLARSTARYPYGYSHRAEGEGILLEGKTAFLDPDSVLSACGVTNTSTGDRVVKVAVSGRTVRDAREKTAAREADGIISIRYDAARIDARDPRPSVDVHYSIEALVPAGDVEIVRTGSAAAGEEHALEYALVSGPIALRPGERFDFSVVLALTFMNGERSAAICREHRGGRTEIGRRMSALELEMSGMLRRMPPLPAADRDLRRLYYHCGMVLLMNSYPAFSYAPMDTLATFGNRTGVFPNRGVFTGFWIEDTSFHALALREWMPDLAREQLLVNLEAQLSDGCIPMFPTVCAPLLRRDSQNPLLGWASWSLYARTKDRKFLRAAYPVLSRYHNWWFAHRDRDGDGLCEYSLGGESGNDNSPRWDAQDGRQEAGAPDIEAVDLASLLIVDARCLALMAMELGECAESGRWTDRARAYEGRVIARMYDRDGEIFHDISCDTHEPRRILTPMSFMPLWAGVDIGEERARAMIERHLLNREALFGPVPFPSVAYNEPTYRSDGFWRGPTWFTHSYFMLQILARYGYRRETAAAVERLLSVAMRNPYICEWYDSRTGDGRGSVMEYSWTAALIIEILLGRHEGPVVESPLSRKTESP